MNKKAFLLDTQAFLFALNSPDVIPTKSRKIFNNPEHELYLSIASIWEMSIKASLGKLKFEDSLRKVIQTSIKESGLKLLSIQVDHIFYVESLPFHHKDPFDRILIAQAVTENMPIVSSDEAFDRYEVKRLW